MEYQRKPQDFGLLDAPRERARHDEHAAARGSEAPAPASALAQTERAPTVEEVLASNAFGHCVDDDLGGSPEQRERREAELEETQQEGVAADFEVDGAGPTSEQEPHPDEDEEEDADGGDYFFPAAADAMPIDEPPPEAGEYGGDGADDAGGGGGAGDSGGEDSRAGGPGDGASDDDAPPSADVPPPPPVTKKSPSRKRK